ncbi:MAG: bifunctional 5,10-methylenetetrahydrofolate dehydrogenase/5,10-methenyltetrahydrofolate cyclohydrolase [Christensenellaceae bacterium]|nr:bifunctional 5,10-methylenetetrahydrofolate dehydrogenase/5,10-methenyltetrahydrofolate cyclohydrolase [Christensenellaceae bacterium]
MLIKGMPVAAAIDENTALKAAKLAKKGKSAKLAVIRMGEKPDDIYYEKSALKRAEKNGIATLSVVLDKDASQGEVEQALKSCSDDESVSGILLLRPLSKHIDEDKVIAMMDPRKDVDGITPMSMAAVFMGRGVGYAPCTPDACIRILDHYGVELSGKNVAVIGRSLVVGKPLAMLLIKRNATVTVCHTKTKDMKSICKNADIVIAAAGKAKMVDESYVSNGQIVIDVGINMDEDGKMVGDVDMASVEPKAEMLTPVPGGVGSVTTSVLLSNTVDAAERMMSGE